MSEVLSTAERLALAVLKGDQSAALALADHIQEEWNKGGKRLFPVVKVDCPFEQLRVVLFLRDGVVFDRNRMQEYDEQFQYWIRGQVQWTALSGAERLEIYQLPLPPIHEVQGPTSRLRDEDVKKMIKAIQEDVSYIKLSR
jgi:hypothetical protein